MSLKRDILIRSSLIYLGMLLLGLSIVGKALHLQVFEQDNWGKEENSTIRHKVIELAKEIGGDASQIRDDEIIPATGLLDSAGILGLVVWYEEAFDMKLKQEEINIDNLGSIDSMANYVLAWKQG